MEVIKTHVRIMLSEISSHDILITRSRLQPTAVTPWQTQCARPGRELECEASTRALYHG